MSGPWETAKPSREFLYHPNPLDPQGAASPRRYLFTTALRWTLPGGHGSGDSCAVGNPPWERRATDWVRVHLHSAGTPRSPRTWQKYALHSPLGTARSRLDVRTTPFRWTSREPHEGGDSFTLRSPRGSREVSTGSRRRPQCSIQNEKPTQEGWE